MYPVILSTPWFNIYSYGVLIALGYTLGTVWILHEAKKQQLPVTAVFDMLLFQLIIGICGSRLLYIIEYSPDKLNFKDFFSFEQGGLTFYGSVISSFIFDLFYLKIRRIPFWQVMDCIGFGMPLGIAIARVGCFLNGCCYGTECDLPWALSFPATNGQYVHPTQLYESLSALLIFFLLQKYRKLQRNHGEVFLASVALYSICRFFIEFLRAENPVVFWGMHLSHFIGIGILAAAFITWKFIDSSKKLRILPTNETKELK